MYCKVQCNKFSITMEVTYLYKEMSFDFIFQGQGRDIKIE